MVEETEYDDVVQCDHSYDKRCHTTYVTNYESQQEEECEENFRKSCFIEYEKIAFDETVNVCRTPLATPPTPSAPSGPRRSAQSPRSQSRSSPPSQAVPRSQGRSVPQLAVGSRKALRSVMTRSRLLSRMPPRNSVLLSPSVPAST